MTKRCFIYIRVSTREQAEEGYSIGEQQERLTKYAEAMGWTIVRVYIDPGHSGATLDRPALQEMISCIKDADLVLVDKLDRLSRSLYDTLYLIKKVFGVNGVDFVSRNEAFDTSTSFGRAMVGILAVFAELERERIKERMADGRVGRAKEGKWHGQIPIGYNYSTDTGGLVVNDYEMMQVREAFDLARQRVPLVEVARDLNEKGYRTQYGRWRVGTLRRVLVSRVYLGEVYYQGEWYDGLHPATIDLEMFDEVQVIMAERSRENDKYRPGRRYASPLGGMVWCKQCGAKYHWRKNGSYRTKAGDSLNYYVCYSRSKSDPKMVKDPDCSNTTYRDFRLEGLVYDEIRKLKSDPKYIDQLRQSVDTSSKQITIKTRIDQLTNQISKLMDLYSLGTISLNEISAKVEPLTTEKRSLESELKTLQAVPEVTPTKRVLQMVDTFEDVLATEDCYAIHDAVAELIDYIEIDGDKIYIHWNF